MSMKPGATVSPDGIDPARRRRGLEIADGGDASAADPHVRAHGRSALPVDHRAAGDQEVVGLLLSGARAGAGAGHDEHDQERERRGGAHSR